MFDFMTFFVMLVVLDASHREFRTGWFVESLATQTLVVFVIRTRRVPFLRSRPSRAMIVTADHLRPHRRGPAVHAARAGARLHRAAARFFLILVGMIVAYLVLVEAVKARFYSHQERVEASPPSPAQRHHRHVRRRAARFTRPPTAVTPAG